MQSHSLIDLSLLTYEQAVNMQIAYDNFLRLNKEIASVCHEEMSDEDIINHARNRVFPPGSRNVGVTLATSYKSVSYYQELKIPGFDGARRPVLMRGSRMYLIWKNRLSDSSVSPNGWAIKVFWRAIRMSRLSFFDADAFDKFAFRIKYRLHSKYNLTSTFTWECDVAKEIRNQEIAIIGGKIKFINPSERTHLIALYQIVKKIDRLDRNARKAAVRDVMAMRLAA
jgi:hypothetical protein